jgi:hypothetical protein
VLVPWGRFSLCHTPIRSFLAFQDQISILIVGCVTTRFTLVGIRAGLRNKVISKVVKIAIQLVKSYDFTSQYRLNVLNRS